MNILFMTSAAPRRAGFSTAEKRPPLGVGSLMAVLKGRGHKVYFSDQYLRKTNILDTDFMTKKRVDFVCIYSNTICFESTLEIIHALDRMRSKGEWGGKVMVGGPHASVGIDDLPDCVDHVVVGEGEISVPKIIEGDVSDRVVCGEFVQDLDSLPMPAWEEFVHLPYDWGHKWVDAYPIYTMNTSRGCPFSCTFCSVKAVWGKTYRFLSAEKIVDQVKFLQKYYGARGIYFREDHFTFNKKRTIEFCELLIKNDIDIEWMCETRVDQLDDVEYQSVMKRAGCKMFYIGVESGSPRMLDFYKKGETREQFVKAFSIAKKVGIKTYASFIVGAPTETSVDVELTESLIKEINPDFVGRAVYLGLPGSELYDYIKQNNLYEYEDELGILYPNGYLKNIKKYYKGDSSFYTYGLGFHRRIKEFVGERICRKFCNPS